MLKFPHYLLLVEERLEEVFLDEVFLFHSFESIEFFGEFFLNQKHSTKRTLSDKLYNIKVINMRRMSIFMNSPFGFSCIKVTKVTSILEILAFAERRTVANGKVFLGIEI